MDVKNQIWYKNAVFYELYLRAFSDSNADGHGDFDGLITKLDYLKEFGVDCIWLLPINTSPLRDDGYDVADYYGILPEYGCLDDFKRLISEAHRRGIKLIIDLVINHTSDQHPWFQAARSDPASPYRDYYVWSDTDQRNSFARIIFVDSQDSNWAWDEKAGQYYWHRFYPFQPDLNFDNPKVQEEMLKIVHYWLDLGVDGFRVDAIPYIFEREGTNCENLIETHQYLKRLREYIDQHFENRLLLCEANQWPKDVRPYLGNGDQAHMGFHFPLMPRIFMSLKRGNRAPLVWVLEQTPEIPENCQWALFLRNHDELTLEMVSEEERQWMWQHYAPNPRMRLNQGIRRRLAPLLENDPRKIMLANSLIFSLPGTPIIYYGDEIGMGDNISLSDRDGVRTPMQWENTLSAGFSQAPIENYYAPIVDSEEFCPEKVNVNDQQKDPLSLWNLLRKMISVRKNFPMLGNSKFEWIENGSMAVAAYLREDDEQQIAVINNLSPESNQVEISLPGIKSAVDMFTSEKVLLLPGGQMVLDLPPFGFRWIELFVE